MCDEACNVECPWNSHSLSVNIYLFITERFTRHSNNQPLSYTLGTFPFSMPGSKLLQLVVAKDVGLSAGVSLKNVNSLSDYSLAFLKHSP
jgi:hypothetical protein